MAAGHQKKRLISSSLHEHYRGKKKKKLDSADYLLNLRSPIYLEWDDNKRKAVAKREQIGITWTDMAPFVDSFPQCRSGLADVLSVPQEIYGLNNLAVVLSNEVWGTCLSESERELLTQFLPSGTGSEQVIHSLLTGENHHFGNPFIKWSTSLCSGNLHPDDVLRREREIRYNKKQYYSELNKYHTDMLEVLKKWKERWSSCKDPEKLWRKGLIKHKEGTLPIFTERSKVYPICKKDMPHKIFIRNGDNAKYMSYIKINKKQHKAIKSLNGDGIQSKSLSRVLGDINSFQVHPYEALEEEEKNRLHEHWLQLVNKDLPVAFEANKGEKLKREKLKKCLEQELSEKIALIIDKTETDNPEISPREQIEDGESEPHPVDVIFQEDVASAPINSHRGHHLERISSLNSCQELSPMSLDQEAGAHDTLSSGNNSPVISQFNEKEDLVEGVAEPKALTSPAKDMWQAVGSHRFNSSSDVSLRKSQPIEERRAPIIDLEKDIMEQEAGESDGASLFSLYASHSQGNLLSSFPKVPEILSSYPPHEHMNHIKQPELQFLMANGSLSESVQFPHQLQEQQNLIEQRHGRGKEHLFMSQMMNKSIYSNGRYPNQELYSSVNSGLVDHNWFPGEHHRVHNNYWSGVEPSISGSQCLGDSGNADGSLFSVLSGCRNMPARSSYDTTNSEQLMEAGSFAPNSDSVYGYVSHQVKSSNSHEAAAVSTPTLNAPWVNYPLYQNPSLQDSIGKPFLRSWNQ